jgi:pimeloyl-ACP methyl ester carboxylesterase
MGGRSISNAGATAGRPSSSFEAAWRKGQVRLATLLPDARHEIATASDHYVQIEQPGLVVDAIRAVVEAVRNPTTWRR